jgi:hypothetical protein
MELYGCVGIDFGTANSLFAYCNHGSLAPQALSAGHENESIPTCVLWKGPGLRREEGEILTWGSEALVEWALLRAEERNSYRFAAAFKPDLLTDTSGGAQTDAWAFLRKAFLQIRSDNELRRIGKHEGMPVYIGVPAEIPPEQAQLTAQIAGEAGFGEGVECIEEPLGALAYHLVQNDLRPADARSGVLVIDFGGGTLDVALMDYKAVVKPWGDPCLGGRLFDDLFYQWVMDQNPELKALSEQDLLYLWLIQCRDIKERFSVHWARDGGLSPLRYPGATIGTGKGKRVIEFENATVDEFRDRAGAYRPSDIARRYFEHLSGQRAEFGEDRAIDLFGWIRQTLETRSYRFGQDFSTVLLTGGSSSWPFMKSLVCEVFDFDPEEEKRKLGREPIFRSPKPEITIGAGLAVYPLWREQNSGLQAGLGKKKSDLMQNFRNRFDKEIKEPIKKELINYYEGGLDLLMPALSGIVESPLTDDNDFYELEKVMSRKLTPFVEFMNRKKEEFMSIKKKEVFNGLKEIIDKLVDDWLKGHSINYELTEQKINDAFDLEEYFGTFDSETSSSLASSMVEGLRDCDRSEILLIKGIFWASRSIVGRWILGILVKWMINEEEDELIKGLNKLRDLMFNQLSEIMSQLINDIGILDKIHSSPG